jgi:antitoxin ParD1/3/4
MALQRISLTEPNVAWLKEQVAGKEYSSKSELVNDLIRQALKEQAEVNWVRAKLEKAEKSGFTELSKAEILSQSKALYHEKLSDQ